MENVGLVVEGGGMRGTYTAGVLDFFKDRGTVHLSRQAFSIIPLLASVSLASYLIDRSCAFSSFMSLFRFSWSKR